jgi:hypothetical protein
MQKARRTANASGEPKQFVVVLASPERNGSHARSTKSALVRNVRVETRNASQMGGTKRADVTIAQRSLGAAEPLADAQYKGGTPVRTIGTRQPGRRIAGLN